VSKYFQDTTPDLFEEAREVLNRSIKKFLSFIRAWKERKEPHQGF
jgi:hypothetical protein